MKIKRIYGGSMKYARSDYQQKMEPLRQTIQLSEEPLVLEIGFASGKFLLETAAANPKIDFIGIEIRKKWVSEVKEKLDRDPPAQSDRNGGTGRTGPLRNVTVCQGDAHFLLPALIPDARLQEVFVLFPDPWWKERHQRKRLLMTPEFLNELARVIAPGGLLHLKTDVPRYAQDVRAMISSNSLFSLIPGQTASFPGSSDVGALTTREVRCLRDGLSVDQVVARRVDPICD